MGGIVVKGNVDEGSVVVPWAEARRSITGKFQKYCGRGTTADHDSSTVLPCHWLHWCWHVGLHMGRPPYKHWTSERNGQEVSYVQWYLLCHPSCSSCTFWLRCHLCYPISVSLVSPHSHYQASQPHRQYPPTQELLVAQLCTSPIWKGPVQPCSPWREWLVGVGLDLCFWSLQISLGPNQELYMNHC